MTGAATMPKQAQLDPLGAGALLLSVLAVCLGVGALAGLVAGSVGYGIAVGALIGVPASIAAVVIRYRNV